MRLQPVRFVGYKLGPFDKIELTWERESRYTLLVGENGMGKTTLTTAMAGCLAAWNESLFPASLFHRLGRDESAFAYLELEIDGKRGAVLRPATARSDTPPAFYQAALKRIPNGAALMKGAKSSDEALVSAHFAELRSTWTVPRGVRALAAAYGVHRDISQPRVREYAEHDLEPLKDLLNPFAPLSSSEIFQWIVNQHVNHALALADKKQAEARAYLAAIQRVEALLGEVLGMPLTFQVKRNPFRFEVAQNGTPLTVDQLSDGTRSFAGWILDYLMHASRVNWANPADSVQAPGLVLVDEIDTHLHPEWQRRVMDMVHRLLPETYVIATTHSPFVLGATDDAQLFRIFRDGKGALQVRASYDEFYGYPADLILEREFVPSLYPPEMERRLQRLADLAARRVAGALTPDEHAEHDRLMEELARVSPWLSSLLALSHSASAAHD